MSSSPLKKDLEEIGLQAVDKFITTFNSRNADEWAESLNFPHVRPSPTGPIKVAITSASYVENFDYQRILETGWDHSEWDYKHLLHISKEKIHAAGQWSRYNTSGHKILTTPIVYIVTKMPVIDDYHWGIQSRFGADYAADEDTTDLESSAFKLIEQFIAHHNSGNTQRCAELLNYPHFAVGIGEIEETSSTSEFELPSESISIESMTVIQAGNRSANISLDLNIGGAKRQVVMNLTDREQHFGIQAWSVLTPLDR